MQNHDEGPDFFNARLKIGKTVWAGNVEVHVKSSDWIRHSHLGDSAYDNVILHVVYDNDMIFRDRKLSLMPVIEIRQFILQGVEERFEEIRRNQRWIPCSSLANSSLEPVFRLWAPALAAERMNYKSVQVMQLLEEFADWDEVLYVLLACGFGFRVNSLPFELLARSLPLPVLRRNCDSRMKIEALLYGQSGLIIRHSRSVYTQKLWKEYLHLRAKYNLKPLKPGIWKKLRLHPGNFPEVRISQFADLICSSGGELSALMYIPGVAEKISFLCLCASHFWDTHYSFGRSSRCCRKNLGVGSANILLINVLAPYLFTYGAARDMSPMKMQAVELLENLQAEDNKEIRCWKNTGFNPVNALESQALLQLKRAYCDYRRCLDCRIGIKLLTKNAMK
jgi:hypothetical protein